MLILVAIIEAVDTNTPGILNTFEYPKKFFQFVNWPVSVCFGLEIKAFEIKTYHQISENLDLNHCGSEG